MGSKSTRAANTKDGIYIISDKPIVKRKGRVICSEDQVYENSLDDLLNKLISSKSTSYVAERDNLYEIKNDVKRLSKTDVDMVDSLIDAYSFDSSYIAFLRKNRAIVPENPEDLFEILEKASKRNISRKGRKELARKADDFIKTYFSLSPLKGYHQNNILKKARKVPEGNAYSRLKGTISTVINKSNRKSIKREVIKELKNIYKDGRYDLIVGVKTDDVSQKAEIAEKLMNDIHSKDFFVFKNIPYIAIPCSSKDIDKVCFSLNNKKRNYLSKLHTYVNSIDGAHVSDICYTPELFMEIASDIGLSKFHSNVNLKNSSWNLQNIRAPIAWETTKGAGSMVLVVDTGVDYNHLDLNGCFRKNKGYNFVRRDDDPFDDNGHGTHVAGIIAGIKTGVAPMSKLSAAKVLSKSGTGTTTDVIRAIDYAIDNNFRIVNMSLGSPRYNHAFGSICRKANNHGVSLIAAAGNDGYGPEYPAAYEGVVSVAALTNDNRHPNFSNIDKTVDISSPGVKIYSTFPGNNYKECTGTSMAAPHIAGVAALASSVKGSLTPNHFEKSLKKTAFELGRGESYQKEKYGAGIAQADLLINGLYKSLFGGLKLWK